MSEAERIAGIIEKHVAYFNGWSVDAKTMKRDCANAADDILRYLKRRDAQLTGRVANPLAQGAGK